MGERKLDDYVTIEEASEIVRMPVKTLREKQKQGLVRAYKPGKRLLFKVQDLHLFIKRYPAK